MTIEITAQRHPLARRGFMMTGLVSGFTLATTVVEAQAIHTDTDGIDAGEIQIPVKDGNLPGYFARPAKGTSFPVILVNEEVFGVNEYIRDVCRRLAKIGYLAVAPEVYARIGNLSKATDQAQIGAITSKLPDAELMSDLDAALAWATRNKGSAAHMGEIGFCRGGRTVWLYAAHNPHLKAAVAFYGVLGGQPSDIQPKSALDVAGEIKCPLLGLYGGKDAIIPVDSVRQAESKAKAAHKTVDIIIYPDAPHGFHADYRPTYREADAKDAWSHALAWFKRYGVAPKGAA
ncbi:MAG TPA: dienelactone hydrolase family protein [Acetobacteraceae bacterium]|nr:dienelactone hydrolase family protein [Acetobacteraceae bacterium]